MTDIETDHSTASVDWDQWDLSGIIKALDLRGVNTGHPGLATTVLFHVLKTHNWPGNLALFRQDMQLDISQDFDFQHTCLEWKGVVLDINGHNHEEFAVVQGLDPTIRFVPMRPSDAVARIVQNMPNLQDKLQSVVQTALIKATTPESSTRPVSSKRL